MEIKLTALQVTELRHKLEIVVDEEDLLESYEVEEDEVNKLIASLPLNDGLWEFDDKYLDLIEGEVQNALDIANDNVSGGHPEWSAAARSMRNLLKKLEGK